MARGKVAREISQVRLLRWLRELTRFADLDDLVRHFAKMAYVLWQKRSFRRPSRSLLADSSECAMNL